MEVINVDLLVTDQAISCFGAGHHGLVSVRIQINHTNLNTYTPSLDQNLLLVTTVT